MTKLAAIYNTWDGAELLRGSIDCLYNHVDLIVIVYQTMSNYGELYNPLTDVNFEGLDKSKIEFVKYIPNIYSAFGNEKNKRNIGIDVATNHNCTHFLHLDNDEYYKNFYEAKNLYFKSGAEGSACRIYTYFKSPNFRFETEDGYFVPFIHKLNNNSFAGNPDYPYYVDPTRRINCNDVVLLDVHMHHFSWVRKDINRKVRNSTAKKNLEKGTMLADYNNTECGPGFYVKDYEKKLIQVDNHFNIEL